MSGIIAGMSTTQHPFNGSDDLTELTRQIKSWGRALGFQAIGISDTHLAATEARLQDWLNAGYHGEMQWMARHGSKRTRPEELVTATRRVISARMDYLPDTTDAWETIHSPERAFISRYALGRDYHKLLRKRLQQLADQISAAITPFGYRVFVDSAPVMEKPLAQKAGLGWIGKHTNLIQREAGSWFFLGEIYTDLPLPIDVTEDISHCGTCTACMDACPTRAIIAPYQLDARLCISYLTIEHPGPIPVELRPLLGNRIYGCDDCQLVCPWNRFAQYTREPDFLPRHGLHEAKLVDLFRWDEAVFLQKTEGSAIRRIGYERWQRNLAVALGNAPRSEIILSTLSEQLAQATPLVAEHIEWALNRHKFTPE